MAGRPDQFYFAELADAKHVIKYKLRAKKKLRQAPPCSLSRTDMSQPKYYECDYCEVCWKQDSRQHDNSFTHDGETWWCQDCYGAYEKATPPAVKVDPASPSTASPAPKMSTESHVSTMPRYVSEADMNRKRITELEKELKRAEHGMEEMRGGFAELTERLEKAERLLKERDEEIEELEEKLREACKDTDEVKEEVKELEEKNEELEEKNEELENNIEESEERIVALELRCYNIGAQLQLKEMEDPTTKIKDLITRLEQTQELYRAQKEQALGFLKDMNRTEQKYLELLKSQESRLIRTFKLETLLGDTGKLPVTDCATR